MRLIAIVLVALGLCACGPQGPTEEGGPSGRPLEMLTVLPSPDDLRGPPARAADAAALQRAFTGEADPGLTDVIETRAPSAAAVREWTDPRGGRLVAAVSVWPSHLVATGVGSDLAARLVADGGEAWTPSGTPGGRGARRAGDRPEIRLGFSVGPNALYVRATGGVSEEVVTRTMGRLRQVLEGQTG